MNRIVLLIFISFSNAIALASGFLAAPIEITDSHGNMTFEQSPERVVVVNWTLTEQVLELGITPLGVADIEGYRQQIIKPAVPNDVIDLGSRLGPSLEKIKSLNPDVIIIGYSQKRLTRKLANIAPVVYFNNFSKHYINAEKADARFLQLAKLFNKTEFAEQKLIKRNIRIEQLKADLSSAFSGDLPKATLIMPQDRRQTWVLGDNSIAQYTLSLLGIEPAIEKPPGKYGATRVHVKTLDSVRGCIMSVPNESFDPFQSAEWQAHPFFIEGCFMPIAPVSIYGGAMSIQYLAEEISKALLSYDFSK